MLCCGCRREKWIMVQQHHTFLLLLLLGCRVACQCTKWDVPKVNGPAMNYALQQCHHPVVYCVPYDLVDWERIKSSRKSSNSNTEEDEEEVALNNFPPICIVNRTRE